MNQQTKRTRMSWRIWVELRDELTALGVGIADEECMQYYLDDHADMLEAVRELSLMAREEFGQDATLTLAWLAEDGVPDGELLLLVRLPKYEGSKVYQRISAIHDVCEQRGYLGLSGALRLSTDMKPVR